MDDLGEIVKRLISENQQSRQRFENLAARTVSAIATGDVDEFGRIVRDAHNAGESKESSDQPLEVGDVDGSDRDQVTTAPSA